MGSKENKSTLLIVDDDTSSRIILKQIFANRYDIIEAVDGKFALDFIRKGVRPDLIILDLNMPDVDGYEVLDELHHSPEFKHIPIIIATADDGPGARREAFYLGAVEVITKPFHPDTIRYRVENILTSINATKELAESMLRDEIMSSGNGDVAGIWGRQRFIDEVTAFLRQNPDGHYAIARWDMDHFKLFNDNFGMAEGDNLLRAIGLRYEKGVTRFGAASPIFYAHWGADHFVSLYNEADLDPDKLYRYTLMQLNSCFEGFDFSISYGFYHIDDPLVQVATMCDRAALALRSIKNRYDIHYCWYDSTMLTRLVDEQEITSVMKKALKRGEFVPYFQPQYNYESGVLIGAEALVRWVNPEKGVIPPGRFVPLFEKNGFISEVDYYMWESVCAHIRKWLDAGIKVPPISVNISRVDLYDIKLCKKITDLTKKYNFDPQLLRLEITESAYMDSPDQLLSVVDSLKKSGFYVEMDDFGSGYSSLNTLKDVPVDMLKLDMKFVADSENNTRGGSILSSVVHMAHGINLPVIAEGVETKQQADYLKTINCLYMQGYLFSKPLPEEEFEKLLVAEGQGIVNDKRFTKAIDNSVDFLDGSTQATLLFNSFVGGAAILEFENDNLRVLRLNDRFFEEVGVPRDLFNLSKGSFSKFIESGSRTALFDAVRLAIESNTETSCEIHFRPAIKGCSDQWLFARFRYLASNFNSHLIYASISNISTRKILEKALYKEKLCVDQILKFAPGGIAEFLANNNELSRIYLSEAAKDVLGYPNTGRPAITFASQLHHISPEDRKRVKSTIQEAIKNASDFYLEFRILLSNGSLRWVSLAANAAKIDSDLHYFGIYTDISKIKATEEMRSENISQGILEKADNSSILDGAWNAYLKTTDDYVFVKDINSVYLCASDAYAKMAGLKSAEDVIGKTDFDIFEDQNLAAHFVKIDMDVLSSGENKINYVEPSTSMEDSSITMAQTSKFAIRDSEGKVIGLYCTSRDITSAHAFEEYKLSLESAGKKIFRYSVNGRVFHDIEQDEEYVSPMSIIGGPEQLVKSGTVLPDTAEKWLSLFDAIDNGERNGWTDVRMVDQSGKAAWYRIKFKSIFDKDGKPFSAIVSYKNVDDYHKNDLARLLEQACVYGSIAALYPSYTATNLTMNLVLPLKSYTNGLPTVTGCKTYDEAVEAVCACCTEKDAKRFRAEFSRETLLKAFTSGETMRSIFVDVKLPDGKLHQMECIAIKINDPEGNNIFSTGLMREIV